MGTLLKSRRTRIARRNPSRCLSYCGVASSARRQPGSLMVVAREIFYLNFLAQPLALPYNPLSPDEPKTLAHHHGGNLDVVSRSAPNSHFPSPGSEGPDFRRTIGSPQSLGCLHPGPDHEGLWVR